MSRDQIFEDRKAKFLKIGRNKGFSNYNESQQNDLEYKKAPIYDIAKNIFKNKYILSGGILLLLAMIVLIINK